MHEVSTFRLYAMRALYLLMFVGQAAVTGPSILFPEPGLDLKSSVVRSFLGAISLLSLLGLRYPLKMLPLMLFEFAWKAIWVFGFWLRLWYGQDTTPTIDETFFEIAIGVVLVPLVVPWGYVWRHYVKAPSERWK